MKAKTSTVSMLLAGCAFSIRTRLLRRAIVGVLVMGMVATVRAQFTVTTNNGAITITGYSGPESPLVIPTQLYGLPVTSIGENAFSPLHANKYPTSVVIPDTITNIADSAFASCVRLTNAFLGNGVVSIGYGAFYGCLFPSVALPSTLTKVGDYAFSTCTSLTGVTIPSSVTHIGSNAFIYCPALSSFTVDPDNPAYSSVEGALLNKVQTELIQVPPARTGTYRIPDSVAAIAAFGFYYCTGLTSVVAPPSVTNVADSSFRWCPSLSGVYFRGNAPSVGLDVFRDSSDVIVYYLPGTLGWDLSFSGRPTAPWVLPSPVILTTAPMFGVQANQFGFRISWATNVAIVVEASTSLGKAPWSPISTNALTGGWCDFRDPQWSQFPGRFYRVRFP